MCEMTSMGEMSAARTTTPWGSGGEEGSLLVVVAVVEVGDLRSDLTTSLTPRLRVLFLAAVWRIKRVREGVVGGGGGELAFSFWESERGGG